jgi:polyhydroxyalkanoate synthesis regulator protein
VTRLITRHANRKLYDSSARRYVSLADVVDLVVSGASVRVVEHPSGEDATPRVLAQALVDLIKRRARSLPAGLMETLLRLAGGTPSRTLARAGGPAPIKEFAERGRREAEAIATRLVSRGRLGIEEALHVRKEVEEAIHRGVQAAEAATRTPINALRPGRAVRTIAGLARELKALETMVARPRARASGTRRNPPPPYPSHKPKPRS